VRDRIESRALCVNRERHSNRNGLSDLGANLRLNQWLMVRDVTNLAGRRRIGVVMVPEANGSREKKEGNRDADCQAPAASTMQTVTWDHPFPPAGRTAPSYLDASQHSRKASPASSNALHL
jgi:hypothetical protein